MKKGLIDKQGKETHVVDLGSQYNRSTLGICTILKKKEDIKGVATAKGVSRLSKQCTSVHNEMEKLFFLLLNEKQLTGDAISETIICKKA